MNYSKKKTLIVLLTIIFTILFLNLFNHSIHEIPIAKEASGTTSTIFYENGETRKEIIHTIGKDFAAIRINELSDLQSITKVNYVPNEFVHPGSVPENYQIVDLNKKFNFAEKGSLIFIIMNLNPESDDFIEQSKKLEKYKKGDYWSFHLSLPNIFNASNIYQKSQLIARNGEIENYDFIHYTTSYTQKTEHYSSKTSTTQIELSFYSRRDILQNNINSGQVITIHYQSNGGIYSGITDFPLIGKESKINAILNDTAILNFTIFILTSLILSIFIVFSWLKHTKQYIPEIILMFAFLFLFFTNFILTQETTNSLFWLLIQLISPLIVLLSVILSCGQNFKYFPLKAISLFLLFIGLICSIAIPYISYTSATVLSLAIEIIKALLVIFIICSILFLFFDKTKDHNILKIAYLSITTTAMAFSLISKPRFPIYYDGLFFVQVAIIITVFTTVFKSIWETEQSNNYLTKNLNMEVLRQTNDLKTIIHERDNILQFFSHDMKKPLASSIHLIDNLIEREQNNEQVKGLNIIKQNTNIVINNLNEVASYAKYNYLAEPSKIIHLEKLCETICDFYTIDCEANGIYLKNYILKKYKVFAKEKGLESAIANIIMNAIEHSSCNTITLSAKKEKNHIVIEIKDNGKGIQSGMDIFKPYVTENSNETSGLGLFICKSSIEAMNGELTYSTSSEGTTFYIRLLIA